MKPYLLIDFGSTYIKMTAVDLEKPAILGTTRALTTVEDGLIHGYRSALQNMRITIGEVKYLRKLACSSAAGGLKMVAIGLVPELTVEAAKRAALGAGARVIRAYGYELLQSEVIELLSLDPDLVLLAGGTDGGDRDTITHNARMLAESELIAPVIIAGNKTVASEVERILASANKLCYQVENVLPEIGRLNIEPVQERIREIFLERIIEAKGLAQVEEEIDGITMPTPAAVLAAARRLAEGDKAGHPGMGDLLLVDVGGATTDVHSVADGLPTKPEVFLRGLPEPRVKRTVEGDLGMRYSSYALLEHYSPAVVARIAGVTEEEVRRGVERRVKEVDYLPDGDQDHRIDEALGFLAVKGAVERHVGWVEEAATPFGISYIQTGKDLTTLKTVIGTGGVLACRAHCSRILQGALYDPSVPQTLKPVSPYLYVDCDYLLPTLGLIAEEYPNESFSLLQKALKRQEPIDRDK